MQALFQYETNSDDVRRIFEEHGEIKTFFDLISTRGMVFVTYVSQKAVIRIRAGDIESIIESLTFELRNAPVNVFKILKSVAGR